MWVWNKGWNHRQNEIDAFWNIWTKCEMEWDKLMVITKKFLQMCDDFLIWGTAPEFLGATFLDVTKDRFLQWVLEIQHEYHLIEAWARIDAHVLQVTTYFIYKNLRVICLARCPKIIQFKKILLISMKVVSFGCESWQHRLYDAVFQIFTAPMNTFIVSVLTPYFEVHPSVYIPSLERMTCRVRTTTSWHVARMASLTKHTNFRLKWTCITCIYSCASIFRTTQTETTLSYVEKRQHIQCTTQIKKHKNEHVWLFKSIDMVTYLLVVHLFSLNLIHHVCFFPNASSWCTRLIEIDIDLKITQYEWKWNYFCKSTFRIARKVSVNVS